MRRVSGLLPALALMIAGTVDLGRALSGTVAQDATPPAGEACVANGLPVGVPVELLPGVVVEVLNAGTPAGVPVENLLLYRLTVQPGGFIPDHTHPGTTVLSVEVGTFRWTLRRGTVWVTRAAATDGGTPAAVAPPERVTKPGTVIDLRPGDGLFYNDEVVHTAENASDEPVVVIVAVLRAAGESAIPIADERGTPFAGVPRAA